MIECRNSSSSMAPLRLANSYRQTPPTPTREGLPCVCGRHSSRPHDHALSGTQSWRLRTSNGRFIFKSIGDLRVTPGVGGLRLLSRGRVHSLPLVHRDDQIRVCSLPQLARSCRPARKESRPPRLAFTGLLRRRLRPPRLALTGLLRKRLRPPRLADHRVVESPRQWPMCLSRNFSISP
jgi:hypothetical protein